MKKLISVLIILALIMVPSSIVAVADTDPIVVEINSENFPDPAFRNILLNESYYDWSTTPATEYHYDMNQDGYFSESELANITYLIVGDRFITSLKGIEYFTSLVELNCQYNSIVSLDLSKNTELMYLNCYHNMLQGPLDLTKNEKLVGIACQNCPGLTEIVSPVLNDLEVLSFENTGITSIDTSKYPKLSRISLSATEMETLDVSQNPELVSISAYNTNLSTLDVSSNPKLEYLSLQQSNLTHLDVSDNPVLATLEVAYTPIAWLNIGDKPNLNAFITDSTLALEVPAGSFDVTEAIPGIDPSKITIESGAAIDGKIISGYAFGTPIVYSYDCGTAAGGKATLKATANLTEKPAAPGAGDDSSDSPGAGDGSSSGGSNAGGAGNDSGSGNTLGGGAGPGDTPGGGAGSGSPGDATPQTPQLPTQTAPQTQTPPATGDNTAMMWSIILLMAGSLWIYIQIQASYRE